MVEQSKSLEDKRVLYILQINKSKLAEANMEMLKCLLMHIIRKTETKHLYLEIYFDTDEFSQLEDSIDSIFQLVISGYNLLEPEHSREFPLVAIEILLPQLFANKSVLLTDGSIAHVFYNNQTNPEQIQSLLNERAVDQNLPQIESATDINQLREVSRIREVEFVKVSGGVQEGKLGEEVRPPLFMQNAEKVIQLNKFETVCMGGTFDHMHSGHRLLLTFAALHTKGTLHCGVTAEVLLKKKAYADHMQSYDTRKQGVEDFLKRLSPKLKANVFCLEDACRVGATLPEIEACILTQETKKGGDMINNARQGNGLEPVELVFCDMVLASKGLDYGASEFSNKTSSTTIRQFIEQEKKRVEQESQKKKR